MMCVGCWMKSNTNPNLPGKMVHLELCEQHPSNILNTKLKELEQRIARLEHR